MEEVGQWLTSIGFAQYRAVFQANAVDGAELAALTDQELESILGIGELSSLLHCHEMSNAFQ